MEEELRVIVSMPSENDCPRPGVVLSTRTRRISSYQHLLETPRHAILRQVLHLLHRTMSNRRFRD